MNQSIWTQSFTEHSGLTWPCPSCSSGLNFDMALMKAYETGETRRGRRSQDWRQELEDKTFGLWLKCGNSACGAMVLVSGHASQLVAPDSSRHWNYYPKSAWPMPDMFALDTQVPAAIANSLRAAFRLFYVDAAASANSLRSAVEAFLDHEAIPRFRSPEGKTKRTRLNLHDRIELYSESKPATAANLQGVRWFGNAGSHSNGVEPTDVLNAMDVLEYVLEAEVTRRPERIAKLARDLTEKHK